MPRRKKPPKAIREQLYSACLAAFMADELSIYLSVHKDFKFPKGMPRGLVDRIDGDFVVRCIGVEKLMRWMYKMQWHKVNYDDLIWMKRSWMRKIEKLDAKFDKILDINVDIDQGTDYNVGIDEEVT